MDYYIQGDFTVLDQELSVISITCIIRILRAHLLASKQFQSIDVPFEVRQRLYNKIETFMDQCENKAIGEELANTLSTCFEIFFEKANEKL
mmetsp:Transcript_26808/g.4829  ORF Transcript_26808/g.4829 Transcript_26808/m.4829 type:complete len:91 (+) Transcript_26808:1694-1966(+)